MVSYDQKHWEELIGVIIDRLGMERFIEMVAYVVDQRGFKQLALRVGQLEYLAAAVKEVE